MSPARCLATGIAGAALLATGCGPTTLHVRPDPSRDGRVVVADDDGRHVVLRDGVTHGPYRGIAARSMVAVDGGRRLAWSVLGARGWSLAVDGVVDPRAFDAIEPSSVVVRGGPRDVVYVGRRGRHAFVVAGGAEHGPFDGVAGLDLLGDGQPLFASRGPDGVTLHAGSAVASAHRDLAFLRAEPGGRRWLAIVLDDGGWSVVAGRLGAIDPPSPAWSAAAAIGEPSFSADGRHVAVAVAHAAPGGGDERTWSVVVDGAPVWTGPEPVDHDTVRLSSGGERVAFAVVRDGLHHVAEVHVASRDARAVGGGWRAIESLTYAPEGTTLGWIGRSDGWATVVVDGERRGTWDDVGNLVLTRGGRDFVAVVDPGGRAAVARVGELVPAPGALAGTLVVDGDHWAIVAASDRTSSLAVLHDDGTSERLAWDDVALELQSAPAGQPLAGLRARVRRALARRLEATAR